MEHREQLLRSVKQLKEQCHVLSGIINGQIVSRTTTRDVEKGISRVSSHEDTGRIMQAIKLHMVLSDRLSMYEDELHKFHCMSIKEIMAYEDAAIEEKEAFEPIPQNNEFEEDNYEEDDEEEDDDDDYEEEGTVEEQADRMYRKNMGLPPLRKKRVD